MLNMKFFIRKGIGRRPKLKTDYQLLSRSKSCVISHQIALWRICFRASIIPRTHEWSCINLIQNVLRIFVKNSFVKNTRDFLTCVFMKLISLNNRLQNIIERDLFLLGFFTSLCVFSIKVSLLICWIISPVQRYNLEPCPIYMTEIFLLK